jgi:hypothetical protein
MEFLDRCVLVKSQSGAKQNVKPTLPEHAVRIPGDSIQGFRKRRCSMRSASTFSFVPRIPRTGNRLDDRLRKQGDDDDTNSSAYLRCIALDRPEFLGSTNKSFRINGGEGEIRTHKSVRECASYRKQVPISTSFATVAMAALPRFAERGAEAE